jgi:hypothetical protein
VERSTDDGRWSFILDAEGVERGRAFFDGYSAAEVYLSVRR